MERRRGTEDAIVLERIPWRERDVLVTLLTPGEGVRRGVARRARGGRARMAAVLEPLNLCRVSYFRRPSQELLSLDEAALLRSAFPLAHRPAAWAAGQVLAELAVRFCPEGQPAAAPFRLLNRCLAALLSGGNERTAVAYAELWLLRLAGVLPDVRRCARCGEPLPNGPWRWEASDGYLSCPGHEAAGRAVLLPAVATAWLGRASRAGVEHLPPPPPAAVAWVHGLCETYLEGPVRAWRFFTQTVEEDRADAGEGQLPPPVLST